MQIRKAIVGDVKNVIEVVQASYKFSYRGYLSDEYLDGLAITDDVLEKWKNYINKKECYVAEYQNQIVAFTMLDSNEETKIFEICILYVRPEYQKQGIGSLLVNFVYISTIYFLSVTNTNFHNFHPILPKQHNESYS